MLVKNLGQTRSSLLNSFRNLSDEQLNQKGSHDDWSISQILYHIYITERNTAELILNSFDTQSPKLGDRKLVFILNQSSKKRVAEIDTADAFLSKKEIIHLLQESRFQYVQAVFNKIHIDSLAKESIDHPLFGEICLKNLADYICLHEKRHMNQIYEIRKKLIEQF